MEHDDDELLLGELERQLETPTLHQQQQGHLNTPGTLNAC